MRSSALTRRSTAFPVVDASAALEVALADVLTAAKQVASYVAVGTEPGLVPREGWLLPILLSGGDLDWAAYDGRLVQGRHGLQEPVGERLGEQAIASCDVMLVPALLVDRAGCRLGRGGGSYDRALRRFDGLSIAVLYEGELVDDVPTEDHDRRVSAVVSPVSGLRRLPAG